MESPIRDIKEYDVSSDCSDRIDTSYTSDSSNSITINDSLESSIKQNKKLKNLDKILISCQFFTTYN